MNRAFPNDNGRGMNKFLLCALTLSVSLSAAQAAVPGAEVLSKIITSQFDRNNDDILDAGEWQSGTAEGFSEIDSNSDGRLTGDELDALKDRISDQTGELTAGIVAALMKKVIMSLDGNGDKVVTKEEYNSPTSDVFGKLDANKDGSISQTELNELATLALGQ